jgi:hypothetical protein
MRCSQASAAELIRAVARYDLLSGLFSGQKIAAAISCSMVILAQGVRLPV